MVQYSCGRRSGSFLKSRRNKLMETPKTVKDVWMWRENAAKKVAGSTPEEERKQINKAGEEWGKRLGLRTYNPAVREEHHA